MHDQTETSCWAVTFKAIVGIGAVVAIAVFMGAA